MLSTMASRELKRPVKTGLTRQQVFHSTTRCSDTIQRVWLGASVDGKLTAIGHDTWSHSARFDDFYENASMQTRSLYAAPNRLTTYRSVGLDLPVSDSASAPGEAVGMLLLEGAMDELALRLRNEPPVDPELIVPYSSRQLAAYLREGAKRFGSERRHAKHDTQAEGRWLIGIGVAAATRGNLLMPSSCSVSLDKQGVLTMRMAMTDISPGSYTVFTQIAAELLGLRMDQVCLQPGDSDTPPTPGSGGSCGAASAESGLYDGRINLPDKLIAKLGITSSEASFSNGRIASAGRSASLGSPAGTMGIAASGEIKPGELKIKYSQLAYGAHFSGVAVDRGTGEIRLPRMLGVFAAGRIFNEKTAKSQAVGAMIWGVGSALDEDAIVDGRHGCFVNHDIAEHHVPLHADILAVEAHFLPEVDDKTNPLKIKDVGELGICGAGAAIANAVYKPCGVRIREFPLTLDRVLAGMERQRNA